MHPGVRGADAAAGGEGGSRGEAAAHLEVGAPGGKGASLKSYSTLWQLCQMSTHIVNRELVAGVRLIASEPYIPMCYPVLPADQSHRHEYGGQTGGEVFLLSVAVGLRLIGLASQDV